MWYWWGVSASVRTCLAGLATWVGSLEGSREIETGRRELTPEYCPLTSWWLLGYILTHIGKGNLNWGTTFRRLDILGGIYIIAGWCRKTQSIIGGAVPGQVGLGYVRKVTVEILSESKSVQHASMISTSVPALASLHDGLWTRTLSFPSCFWSWCLSQQQKNK